MTTIKIITKINAPLNTVFDLNRNIDIHKQSTSKSKETAIDGVTSGLINKGETVTWRGKHFGFYLIHQSLISAMDFDSYFVDEMISGTFKSFKHHHFFEEKNGIVTMKDEIYYETPFGIFGSIFNKLILKRYLTNFIAQRNEFIKNLAENR